MPTYEYHCGSCKSSYDLQESFSAPNKHRCKECKRGTARRVLTPPTIVFKGSGFYVTDSKGTSSTLASADSAPSSDSGGDTGSDTTPAPNTPSVDSPAEAAS